MKILLVLLVGAHVRLINFVFLLFILSCQKGNGNLTVSLNPPQLDDTLDTRTILYTSQFHLLENLTARLVRLDEAGDYQYDLATEIKKITDKKYSIKIKDTYFTNGEKVTLQDVKKTIERVIRLGSSNTSLADIIDCLEIFNDELIIKLKKPSKSLFYYFSLPDLGILHSTQLKMENLKAKDFQSITSGPFRYDHLDGDYYLVKNNNYKLTNNTFPERIKLISPFKSDTLEGILNHRIDLGQVSIDSFLENKDLFNRHKDFELLGTESDTLTYLFFNPNSKLYKIREFRKWIICNIQSEFKIPNEYEKYTSRSFQYFSPESKAYLADSDLTQLLTKICSSKPYNFPRKIIIKTYTTAYSVTFEPVVRILERIPGLKIEIQADVAPKDVMKLKQTGEYDLFLNIMTTDYRIPVEAINFEYFSPHPNLKDTTGRIKQLFHTYRTATNEEEENNLLKRISSQMLKDEQIIPLFHSVMPLVYNKNKVDASGLSHLFLFNFWKLKIK